LLYTDGGTNIVIDAGPDFRQQMLRTGIDHLDAILITHEHNDHVIGLDDVRPFNFRSGHPMRVYALPRVVREIRNRFEYVFGEAIPGIPRIELVEIEAGDRVQIGNVMVEAFEVMHGSLPILGFRFADFVYITDMKTIRDAAFEQIKTAKYLVASALHKRDHTAHMRLDESLAFAERFHQKAAPSRGIWLIHMSHHMGLMAEVSTELPDYVQFAHDGLTISL
jgi:phosphoribosyl 1,2-cyclic phosphate phosphodiesterase